MADSSMSKSRGGCFGTLLALILQAGAVGLGVATVFIVQPQDLKDIGGYLPAAKSTPVRDLKTVLQNAIERQYPLTLTETEINRWLGRTLSAKQGGLLAKLVTLDRVLVRLEDGYAEVVIGRKILGQPFTVSMFLKVGQAQGPKGVLTEVQLQGGPYHEALPQPLRGGRFGRLVVPQGFLLMVLPAYQQLVPLFSDEIHLGFEEMAHVKIEKHRLLLDPREPSGDRARPSPLF